MHVIISLATVVYMYKCPDRETGILILICWGRKGDYYRYLAEFKEGDDRTEAADQSLKAYEVCFIEFSLLDIYHLILFL